MATFTDLLQDALSEIGVYSPGQTLTDADLQAGFRVGNRMVDQWSNERLMLYEIQERSFTLTPGTNQYTIGTGGTINTTRPLAITQAYIRDTGNNRYLMNILPRDKWNQIGNVSSNITSQIPTSLFYDPQYPLGVINVFPTPLVAYPLFYDNALQLTQFASVTTSITLPPGYEAAIVHNLAVQLGPYFRDSAVSQDVKDLAAEAKATIKRTNLPEIIANYDPYLLPRPAMTYNIFRDGYS